MRTVAAFLLIAMFGLAASNDEKDVLGAIEKWKQAALHGDTAGLNRIYHDGLLYTHSNGMTQNKATAVSAETAPTGVYKGVDMRDVEVHVYGDTALVEYKLDLTHFAGDVAHLHELMVWKKGSEGWQMLARHATKLPVAAP
jgi:ketosteroid isomerase-like protein